MPDQPQAYPNPPGTCDNPDQAVRPSPRRTDHCRTFAALAQHPPLV